jgi:hypothetical protein
MYCVCHPETAPRRGDGIIRPARWWGSWALQSATHAWHKPGKVWALGGCQYWKIEILIRSYDGIVGRGYRWMRVGPFFEAARTAVCQGDAHLTFSLCAVSQDILGGFQNFSTHFKR